MAYITWSPLNGVADLAIRYELPANFGASRYAKRAIRSRLSFAGEAKRRSVIRGLAYRLLYLHVGSVIHQGVLTAI